MKTYIVAVSGIQGSFSEQATQKYCSEHKLQAEFRYCVTPRRTFAVVDEGQADFGIVPLANSAGGAVEDSVQAMARYQFKKIAMVELPIAQHLLAKPGVKPQDVRAIVSHPQALAQCRLYLARNWLKTPKISYPNTALAAKDLSSGKLRPTSAVIGSAVAGQLYGLQTIAKNIQDLRFNFTSFMVFKGVRTAAKSRTAKA